MLTAPEIYQHAMKSKPQIEINGINCWIIEGDLLVDEGQLYAYALRQVERVRTTTSQEQREGLVAMTDENGRVVRWNHGKILTYYVRRTMFDNSEYEMLLAALHTATADWEATCNVKFQHLERFDSKQISRKTPPLFDVTKVQTDTGVIASAFFPNDPPERRHLNIYPAFFAEDLWYDRAGVLRHELGHVLGFRHEHLRTEAPAVCPTEELLDRTFNLSDYDPSSVMHYFCGGVGSQEMRLTEVDRLGARQVYGLPDHEVAYFD